MLTVVIDESDWNLASEIAESTLIKSLDSLHLAIARNLGLKNLSFLTFDKKQASVARQMGFSVVGA
jgi:predicted nucleic acid-binding protein